MRTSIKPDMADTVWVHPCSIVQVETLPEALPVQQVILSKRREFPERGQKVWILWTHLGDDYCRDWLTDVQSRAKSWQVIEEGQGRGLALAEF